MAAAAIHLPSSNVVQSPSVEDLLSARSKRSVPVQSFYSTFTTATELDLPEAARLAMREEAANGVWSPSMNSAVSEDDAQAIFQRQEGQLEVGLETPTMSESQYSSRSRSPSMASVKVAAIVKGESAKTMDLSATATKSDQSEQQQDSTSPKRLLNSRNLQINTALSAAHAYPQQLTTPSMPTGRSAHIGVSAIPLTSRSLPGNFASAASSAAAIAAPLSAIPPHITRPRRRSSLDSLSTLASPTLGDDDALGLHQASLQRMQSFLGPKMKHISPAPWNNENANDAFSDYTSEGSFWNDDDPEIGSVQLATKTPRSKSMKEALGLATSANVVKPEITTTGTLKGLGLAIAAATSVASPSRPSVSSETSTKSRTMTASSDTSMYSGKASKFRGFLSRSESRDVMASPPPPVPSHTTMKVSNITRSKTPEPAVSALSQNAFLDLAAAKSAPAVASTSGESLKSTISPSSSRRRSLSNMETAASKLAAVNSLSSSTPVSAVPTGSAIAQIAETKLLPDPVVTVSIQARRAAAAPVRKRPPVYRQDTAATTGTTESVDGHATSMTATEVAGAMAIPPAANGMKLVSLDVARDRERARSPASTPTSPHPPPTSPLPVIPAAAAPAKTVKSKKSGFLKLFKYKEDPSAPAVPRPSLDELPSPTVALQGNRSVSSPTDFRRGEPMTISSARAVPASNGSAAQQMTKARSDTGNSTTLLIRQPASIANVSESTRRPNASAPPSVALVEPSPDLSKEQMPFPAPSAPLPMPPGSHLSKAKRTFVEAQEGLAPSLSLRPVSMMFASMPQAFLADLKAVESNKALHGINPSSLGSDSLSSPPAARTPDTPSFVFFDPDNVVTPPAVGPANAASKAPFGLPTPPHSASSARTGYPGLPKPPSSPSLAHTESAHAALSAAAYRARILVLEKQVAVLQARLASAGQVGAAEVEKINSDLVEADSPTTTKSSNKACERCGCSCKAGNAQSILARPRAVVGTGNSFSSALRD